MRWGEAERLAEGAPNLQRIYSMPIRPKPKHLKEVLAWASKALAKAEVALIAQLDRRDARAGLSRVATPHAAGADFYGTLSESPA